MRKLILAVVWCAVLFGVASVLPAQARPRSADWGVAIPWAHFDPVEQQTPCSPDGTHCGATQPDPSLWVVNRTLDPSGLVDVGANRPLRCAWDADDKISAGFSGSFLDAGATVSGSLCIIADWVPHLLALRVTNPGLVGTLSLPGHLTITVPGGQRGCIAGPVHDVDSSLLGPIPDSNGGVGIPMTVTWSMTNPTSRRIRDIDADAAIRLAGFSFVAAEWCPFPIWEHGQPLYPIGHDPQVWSWVGA